MTADNIVTILLSIFSIVGTIATAVLIPYINQKIQEKKLKNVKFWVVSAVRAAEKMFADPKEGEKKRAFVLDFLEQNNIVLSDGQLRVLIEAACQDMLLTAEQIKDYTE
jgi:Bacteriophage holin of superfamily 6 (Holin_LLH)